MAKKKRSTSISDALTEEKSAHSWKNQFTDNPDQQAQNEISSVSSRRKTDGYKRKTYLMTEELIQRIEAQAQAQQVGVNEMARYCLDIALTLMESGEHRPEVQEVTISKRTLGM